MFAKNKIASAMQTYCLIATALSGSVLAEEQKQPSQELEKIQVTGSRIARYELSQPSPTITITSEQIEQAGIPDLASVLAELPAIGATGTLRANTGSSENAGSSSIDLRRLGTDRTLVLVNGKRHVAGQQGSAVVDLSTIPTAMIKRVEVITGGASAIYGSDAVSGVVNIITRDDFEGLELKASFSDSLHGVGNQSKTFSLVGGVSTSDGKGNATVYITKDTVNEVMERDMPHYSESSYVANPADTGEDDGIVDRIWAPNILSEWISQTSVLDFIGSNYTFDNAGNGQLMPVRGLSNSAAFGSFPDGCELCFSTTRYENFLPERDKVSVGSFFNYQLSDNVKFYSDVKFVRSDIFQQAQPAYRFGEGDTVNLLENPYVPDEAVDYFADKDMQVVTINKFFDEIGNREARNKRETFRLVSGIAGDFTLSDTLFDYDVYYSYGRTENDRVQANDLIIGNWVAALDTVIDPETGLADCRSNVASKQGEGYSNPATVDVNNCVPYNPFGYDQASDEAKAWISANVTREDTIKQRYFGGSISFDSMEWFELPGGAMGMALGYEKRWESSGSITDELTKSGALNEVATPDTYGQYDVSEWFVEVNLPLLSDAFLAHELSLDGAFRRADYSHAGEVDAWKVGFMWSPFEGYSLRGTYSEAVRAPNVTEAFSPRSPDFARVWDPCDNTRLANNPNRAANCAALGIPADHVGQDNASKRVILGGNPNLTPEESTSFTIGFVATAFEDLSFSIDYYDIEITDAIQSIEPQTVANNCVDGPELDPQFCGQIRRDPSNNSITFVESGYLNTAKLALSGVEADINYKFDLADLSLPGQVKLNLFVNHVLDYDSFEFQNRPDVRDREDGQMGDPTWQATFRASYKLDDINVTWSSRFIDRSAIIDLREGVNSQGKQLGDNEEDRQYAYAPSMTYHDVSARYSGLNKLSLEVGIRNVFDKILPEYVGGAGVDSAIYDPWGRRAFVNISYRF
ncbi:Vitamin B12 transporter BtuB [Pseudoalteromonas holothuriae]|uniref:Vitamin B12 transporter BtuB n=1 Tax=Pseudoalteromonas holothuriae TaxID=2963714 RepID=A0A9W4VUJ6_9GAMM|nr:MULTISPECIES: TonB-dependent receptor [unclassified Pseudoalteromonas]CAH9052281.1 Vitamin B12 transporter BtuB [Pseudoalteromonas sp. CIP111951]CAH9064007.1 Vitamin B12 transporter BtuB [Pseudoalteromonas sp. CIP111854]